MSTPGHGHVTPNPGGMVARCGGPALCHECACERMETGLPVRTGLFLGRNCEDWDVPADSRLDDDDQRVPARAMLVRHAPVPAARLRRIGWLDQLGRVWLHAKDWDGKGGSITPLLIDPGERDGV